VTEKTRRRRTGWLPDPFGALGSFLIEALIVLTLALATLGVAMLALWLV